MNEYISSGERVTKTPLWSGVDQFRTILSVKDCLIIVTLLASCKLARFLRDVHRIL